MPPADNTRFLHAATQRRSAEARSRAQEAIAAAPRTDGRVTVVGVARAARVSRSWLYTQSDLIDAIGKVQNRPATTPPARHKTASQESLQQRLEAAHRRNEHLRDQNAALTDRLEAAYGEIRRLRTMAGRYSP